MSSEEVKREGERKGREKWLNGKGWWQGKEEVTEEGKRRPQKILHDLPYATAQRLLSSCCRYFESANKSYRVEGASAHAVELIGLVHPEVGGGILVC